MKKLIPVLAAIILIIVIGGIAFGPKVIEKYTYSHEKTDLYEYFHIVNEDEIAIVLQNDLMEEKAIICDNVCYFDLDTVHKYFNDRFYIDENEQLLLYTTPTQIIRTNIDSNEYLVDTDSFNTPYKICFSRTSGEQKIYYIAADFVKTFTNFSYIVFENPNRMQVYTKWEENKTAILSEDNQIRILGGVKSPIICEVKAGDKVIVLDKMDTWCKVKTENAFIGYVENKYLTEENTETMDAVTDYVEPEYTSLTKDNKIGLGFHAIYATSGNETINEVTASAKGLNVLAPTWFSIMDDNGSLRNFSAASYVEKAHKKGIEVWGVVDDFNYKLDKNVTIDLYKILSTTTIRTALINNICHNATECGMDGINIDFEGVNAQAGPHFVQFLRELSIQCRKLGLILSVDNYVPYHYNEYYDLQEQGTVCDYVIIMGYDEHYAGSAEAGSVASIDYVRYGIEKTCEMVPSNKVVNALPFYSRLWITSGTDITSEAYPMNKQDSALSAYDLEASWDDKTGQNFAEKTSGDKVYKIWLEDTKSIGVKLNVMQTYNLGGVAAWRLGYEVSSVWDLIEAYLGK